MLKYSLHIKVDNYTRGHIYYDDIKSAFKDAYTIVRAHRNPNTNSELMVHITNHETLTVWTLSSIYGMLFMGDINRVRRIY